MTIRTETELKAFFESGDKPTETQFADFIETARKWTDSYIFNETQQKVYIPASSSPADHFTALETAIESDSAAGDSLILESIFAESSTNTLTIAHPIKISATNSKITRSGDSDYLIYVSATGDVDIEGIVLDGGYDNPAHTGWTTLRNELLRVTNSVPRFILRNVKMQNGHTYGSENYAALLQSEEAYFYNVYFENGGRYHLRFDGRHIETHGLRSSMLRYRENAITDVTEANPPVVTSAGHGWVNGQQVVIYGVVGGMSDNINGEKFTVGNATTNDFELQGENSSTWGSYDSGGFVSLQYRHLTTANADNHTDQVHKHIGGSFRSDMGGTECVLATIDNEPNTQPVHFELNSTTANWLDSTNVTTYLLKIEGTRNVTLKDLFHIGDNLDDNCVAFNFSGSASRVTINNCVSPGNFYFPSTLKELYIINSRFGLQSDNTTIALIQGISFPKSTHRVTYMHFDTVEFHGMTDNAFSNTTPDDVTNHRITYNNLKLRFFDSSLRYVHNQPRHNQVFVGKGLDVFNDGTSSARLSNSSPRRLMMSHDGNPKVMCYGIRNYFWPPSNSAVSSYGSSTSGDNHPTPAQFNTVSGFIGDIIENCDPGNGYNAAGWMYDGTQWVERHPTGVPW